MASSINLSFDFEFVPRREVTERLEEEVYTSAEELEFHLRHEAKAPTTPTGGLDVKVGFLTEIAEKAISLLGERASHDRNNVNCARAAAKAKRALADVLASAVGDGGILPQASRLGEEFVDLKSKSGDVVGELQREQREFRRYRWWRKLAAFMIMLIVIPICLNEMFPGEGAMPVSNWGVKNYFKLIRSITPTATCNFFQIYVQLRVCI